jgi:hypothetical protein
MSRAALRAANNLLAASKARNAVTGPCVTLKAPQCAGKKKTSRTPNTAINASEPVREIIFIIDSRLLY